MAFQIRRAMMNDLDVLVSFTLAEALEAEGIEGSAETVSEGVQGKSKTAVSISGNDRE